MIDVEIDGGICGFTTIVHAIDEKNYKASFQLETECPNWVKVNKKLGGKPLDIMTELFKSYENGKVNSEILEVFFNTIPHISCPVLSGIYKALEVTVGLALPKDAEIRFKNI